RAGKRQVGYDARPLRICLIVVGVPSIVSVFRPGCRGANTGTVAVPDEQAAFANAMRDVAQSIAVEVADSRRADRPAAGEFRPAGGSQRTEARLHPSSV